MAIKIMFSNQKGGVGKTTTILELCALYHSQNKRVLAIDLDPQGDLSLYTRIKTSGSDVATIRDVLLKVKKLNEQIDDESDDDILDRAIQKTEEGFDMIAADNKLCEAQADFYNVSDIYLLRDLFSVLEDDYDYIFVDCAPARSPLLNMTYIGCDYCLVISESDLGSIKGVKQVYTDISLLIKNNFSKIKILGILLNKNEDTRAHQTAYRKLCNLGQQIGSMPFDTTIYKGIAVTEAKNSLMSIRRYCTTGNKEIKKKAEELIAQYDELGKEIDERLSIMEG